DTIVAVAAMTRYYRTGRFSPLETGILVWRDFIVPLWSTTITTIWAFVPLLLSTGIIGEFIKPIPIVVTATMLSSTTISVIITIPLMVVLLKPTVSRRVKIAIGTLCLISLFAIIIAVSPKNIMLPLVIFSLSCLLAVLYHTRTALWTQWMGVYQRYPFLKKSWAKVQSYSDEGILDIEHLSGYYGKIIDKILSSKNLRRNTIIAISVFALCAYLLVPLGIVKNEFFPKTNEDIVYMSVEMPKGTNADRAKGEMTDLLQKLRSAKDVDFITAESGQTIGGQGDRVGDQGSFSYTLHLIEKSKRKETSQDIAESLRKEFQNYQKGKLTVQELSGGPPAGADIQIKLLGDDLQTLDTYADKIVENLKSEKGIINPEKSVKPGLSKIVFSPHSEKLVQYNVGIDQIAFTLRTFASGFELDSLGTGDDKQTITYKTDTHPQSPEKLYLLTILTASGPIPITELGEFHLSYNPTGISRENGKRTISVSAGVAKGYNIPEKSKSLEKFAGSLKLPEGYSWQTGGVNDENNKSVQSILKAMILAALLILITMIIEFGSYRQALIALLLIPLSIAGVLYIFGLTGIPLSFPALIGILALFGIVVTHAIVVIEKINENRSHGLPLQEAIVDAAKNRLEPVLLTSMATILGLLPVTLSDPLWRGLGGAIIAGLLFSGAIKLFFVPVMYYNWFKD
ncbi:MAG: efflux RND transporter permease subunit, partial [Candidatus Roizmanbacteria bacterium]